MEAVDVVMRVVEMVVPGVGTAMTVVGVLREIYDLSDKIEQGKDTCKRVHQRLSDILAELQKMEETNSVPPTDALTRYFETLSKSLAYLTKYSDKSLFSRWLTQQEMIDEVRLLHEEIDTLMRILNLAANSAMMQWKQEWEKERAVVLAYLARIAENNEVLLAEVKSQKEMQEAIFLLVSKLKQSDFPAEKRESAEKMLSVVRRRTVASVPDVPDWFIPRDDVKYDSQPFDRGSFSSLHRGIWGSGTQVVVKTPVLDGAQDKIEAVRGQFEREVDVWRRCEHPHVVKLHGACHIATPPFFVCEEATNGNLASYIERRGRDSMWKMLYESALGLAHIHSKHVVHRDLKLNNLLVGTDGKARVADFGLSVICRASVTSSSQETPETASVSSECGGVRWRAPECFNSQATYASDVYSLGMCIIEALSGEPPYGPVADDTVAKMIRDGERPPRPSQCPDDVWALVETMTAWEPSKRATLDDVISRLKVIMEECQMTVLGPDSSVQQLVDALRGGPAEEKCSALKLLLRKAGSDKADAIAIKNADGVRAINNCAKTTSATWSAWAYASACMRVLCRWGVISDKEIAAAAVVPQSPTTAEINVLSQDLRQYTDVEEPADAAKDAARDAAELLSFVNSWPVGTRETAEGALVKLLRVGTPDLMQVAAKTLYVLSRGQNKFLEHQKLVFAPMAREFQSGNTDLCLWGLKLMEKAADYITDVLDVIPYVAELANNKDTKVVLCAFELLVCFAVKHESSILKIEELKALQKFVTVVTIRQFEYRDRCILLLCELCGVTSSHSMIESAGVIEILSEAFECSSTKNEDKDLIFFALGSLALGKLESFDPINPTLIDVMLDERTASNAKPNMTRLMVSAAKCALESGQDRSKAVALQLLSHIASAEARTKWLLVNMLMFEPILRLLKSEGPHRAQAAKTLRHMHGYFPVTAQWKSATKDTAPTLVNLLGGNHDEISEALKLLQSWNLYNAVRSSDVIDKMSELLQIDKDWDDRDEIRVLAAGAFRNLIDVKLDGVTNAGIAEILSITRDLKSTQPLETRIAAAKRILDGAQSHSSPWSFAMAQKSMPLINLMLESSDEDEQLSALEAVASLLSNSVETLPFVVDRGVSRWVDELKCTSMTGALMPRCKILSAIASASAANRESMIAAGGVRCLIKLLCDVTVHKDAKDMALSIFISLINCPTKRNRVSVVEELLKMVDSSDEHARLDEPKRDDKRERCDELERCGALDAVASLMTDTDVTVPLVMNRGVETWVGELKQATTIGELKPRCKILEAIAIASDEIRESLVRAGGVPYLVKLAQDDTVDNDVRDIASSILTCLTSCTNKDILHGVVEELLKMVDSSDEKERGVALGPLQSLVTKSPDTVPLVAKRGLLKWVDELKCTFTSDELLSRCRILLAMAHAGDGEQIVCSGAVAFLVHLGHDDVIAKDVSDIASSEALELLKASEPQCETPSEEAIAKMTELLQIDKVWDDRDDIRVLSARTLRRLKGMTGVSDAGVAEILFITHDLGRNQPSETRIAAAKRIVDGASSQSSSWSSAMAREAIPLIHPMLESSDEDERFSALEAVASLLSCSVETLLFVVDRGVETWVGELKQATTIGELKPRCKILEAIAIASDEIRESLVRAGGVPYLVKLAQDDTVDNDVRDIASSILTCLTSCTNKDILHGVVEELLKMVDSSDEKERGVALGPLQSLVTKSPDTVPLVAKRGLLKWVDELKCTFTSDELLSRCRILLAMAHAGDGEQIVCSGAVAFLVHLGHDDVIAKDVSDIASSEALELLKASEPQCETPSEEAIAKMTELLQIDKVWDDRDDIRVLSARTLRRLKGMTGVSDAGVAEILFITHDLGRNQPSETRIAAAKRIVDGASSQSSSWSSAMAREAIPLIHPMLESSDEDERFSALEAVASLLSCSVETLLFVVDRGVETWVGELKQATTIGELKPRCKILEAIAIASDEIRESLVRAGGVPYLVKLAQDDTVDNDVRDIASSILTCLTSCTNKDILHGVVEELLKMVDSSDEKERGVALGPLQSLVTKSPDTVPLVAKRGLLKWVDELKCTFTSDELLSRCRILLAMAHAGDGEQIVCSGAVAFLVRLGHDDMIAKDVSDIASSEALELLKASEPQCETPSEEAIAKMTELLQIDKSGVEDDEIRVLSAGALRRLKRMDGVSNAGVAEVLCLARDLGRNQPSETRIAAAKRIVDGADSQSSSWSSAVARESITPINHMLESSDDHERVTALEAVASLLSKSTETPRLVVARGVDRWVGELKHTTMMRELKPRCTILEAIALAKDANHSIIILAGGVPCLVKLTRDDRVATDVRALASSIMDILTKRNRVGVVENLLKMVDSCDEHERCGALELLASVMNESGSEMPNDIIPLVITRGVDIWVNELVHSSTSEELVARCKILNEIADVNEAHHGTIIQAGAVPFLAKWARDDKAEDVKAIASSILKCLMTCSYRSHVVEALLTLVQSTTSESDRLDGLRGIELSVSSEASSYLVKSDAVDHLVELTRNGSDKEKSRAVSILSEIVASKDDVGALNKIVKIQDSDLQAKAVWKIGALARRSSIARLHPTNLSIVPVLVEMARNGDEKKKESAAFALGSLMKSNDIKRAVKEEGGYAVLKTLVKSGSADQVKYAKRAISIGEECCIS